MPNPASIADVERRWRALTDQETVNAEAYLEDAWWLLTARQKTLEADLATIPTPLVSQGNVVRVVTAMVLRILKNPDAKVFESIDDYSYRRANLLASGELMVTPDELASVTPGGRSPVRTVKLVAYADD